MNELGRNTPAGFMPAVPSLENLLQSLAGGKGRWDETNNSPAGADMKKNRDDDLLRCYVQCFATPAGQKVLEDILDMTLRRSPYLNNDEKAGRIYTPDQQLAYGLERKGQNGTAISILSKIVSGQALPNPAAAKKSRKKT